MHAMMLPSYIVKMYLRILRLYRVCLKCVKCVKQFEASAGNDLRSSLYTCSRWPPTQITFTIGLIPTILHEMVIRISRIPPSSLTSSSSWGYIQCCVKGLHRSKSHECWWRYLMLASSIGANPTLSCFFFCFCWWLFLWLSSTIKTPSAPYM